MKTNKGLLIFSLIFLILILQFFRSQTISAPQNTGQYKVGILMASDNRSKKIDGLLDGLKRYNFQDSEIHTVIKNAEEDKTKLLPLSEELVNEEVDIIVTTGIQETNAAKMAVGSKDIPIVFIGVGCSVELGLVKDNISPACNITGIDSHYVQLSGKRIEYLKKLVPDIKQVLVLYNPSITPIGPSSKFLFEAAEKLDLELIVEETNSGEEILTVLEEYNGKVDGAILMCSLFRNSSIDNIVNFTIENKLPILGVDDLQVERGMLAFYGTTNYDEGIQGARIVANILRGQSPTKIPIETPENLELHVNVETAKLLGIEINKGELIFVDKFITGKSR